MQHCEDHSMDATVQAVRQKLEKVRFLSTSSMSNVDMPNLVTYPNGSPVFECYVVR